MEKQHDIFREKVAMTIVSASLFKALKEAGVNDALAEQASSDVAESTRLVLAQDNKIDKISSELKVLQAKIDNQSVLFDSRINALDAKIDQRYDSLNAKIDNQAVFFDSKINALDAKIDAQSALFNAKIDKQNSLIKTVITLNIAILAGVVVSLFIR